jgi:hypothetical protein
MTKRGITVPIKTVWDDEENGIIRFVFEGKWTWADMEQAREDGIALSKTSSHPSICVIADMRNTSIMPEGAIQQTRNSLRTPLPSNNLNFTVLVGANMFIEMFYNVLKRIFQAQMTSTYAVASSLEDARVLIERRRQQQVRD